MTTWSAANPYLLSIGAPITIAQALSQMSNRSDQEGLTHE